MQRARLSVRLKSISLFFSFLYSAPLRSRRPHCARLISRLILSVFFFIVGPPSASTFLCFDRQFRKWRAISPATQRVHFGEAHSKVENEETT